ncbi:MAG: hypothetical protein E1N59_698 [Puniceicoccaceae bacterium 5H]|nr:MAG: hypothetical protein E1N59_698 [Puniceicoccaceae bacterium 5H]
MYGKKDPVTGWTSCSNCGRHGKSRSYSGRKWGHLYFIPLIPVGGHVRVLHECPHCKKGAHLPADQVEPTLEQLREQVKQATGAIYEGRDVCELEGQDTSCALTLAGVVKPLYALNRAEEVGVILEALQQPGVDPEAYFLTQGASLEYQGDFPGAAQAYSSAIEAKPDSPRPMLTMGKLRLRLGQFAEARPIYESLLQRYPDDLNLRSSLLTVYEQLGAYPDLVANYEAIFERLPHLKKDRKLFKCYQKACKQAGTQPVSQ